jgi:hypothetical protein
MLVGIGICHCGAGSEAGSNTCYIKFGAVKPVPTAGNNFDKLLDACEAFAVEEGMSRIVAGVNTDGMRLIGRCYQEVFRLI